MSGVFHSYNVLKSIIHRFYKAVVVRIVEKIIISITSAFDIV